MQNTVYAQVDESELFVAGAYSVGFGTGERRYPTATCDSTLDSDCVSNTPLFVSFFYSTPTEVGSATNLNFSIMLRGEDDALTTPLNEISFVYEYQPGGLLSEGNITNCALSSGAGIPDLGGFTGYLLLGGTTLGLLPSSNILNNSAAARFFPPSVSTEIIALSCPVDTAAVSSTSTLGLGFSPRLWASPSIFPDNDRYSRVELENNLVFRPVSNTATYVESALVQSDGLGVVITFSAGVSSVDSDGSDFSLSVDSGTPPSVGSAVSLGSDGRTYFLGFNSALMPGGNNVYTLDRVGAIDGVDIGALANLYLPAVANDSSCQVPQISSAVLDADQTGLTVDFTSPVLSSSSVTASDFIVANFSNPNVVGSALGGVEISAVSVSSSTQFSLQLGLTDNAGSVFQGVLNGSESFDLRLADSAIRCDAPPYFAASQVQTGGQGIMFAAPPDTEGPEITSVSSPDPASCSDSKTITVTGTDATGIDEVSYSTATTAASACNGLFTGISNFTAGTNISASVTFSDESDNGSYVCFRLDEMSSDRFIVSGAQQIVQITTQNGIDNGTVPTVSIPSITVSDGIAAITSDAADSGCGVSDVSVAIVSGQTSCSDTTVGTLPTSRVSGDISSGGYLFNADMESYNGQFACFVATDQLGGVGIAVSPAISGIDISLPRIFNVRVFLGGAL